MNKIIMLIVMNVALSACGAIPAAVDTVPRAQSDDGSGVEEPQVAANESGLGTISFDERTRADDCGKVRRTGSHLYISRCDDPDGGSQPVRYGTWNELGKYAMSGSVRPED